jgi:type I restriction enzyme M protein
VPPDVLGRAYEYLIKQFADDAGAKAGEFFTPPEVVDTLVRILEPQPGNTVYDPTGGSGGMLVHSADFLREKGHHQNSAQYFAQEMNWGNAAIAKINSVLHGLEANIQAGRSTVTDPAFVDDGAVRKFSVVLANFPFSDEFWWLKPEQQTDDKKKREKLKKLIFGKDGYKDPYSRFGRGTPFPAPPAGYGDYAFILHIFASLAENGRAGVVCPQGVLFRGQPEIEEETGEFDDDGNPIIRKRKADDEHLIRKGLLDARVIDAVFSLPLNIFYGAGVPACLLILRKDRPPERRDQVLLVYAARDYRELSAQNELRPQDVMRMLVHYHAYGDSDKVPKLIEEHIGRIRKQIDLREEDEVGRLQAEYKPYADKQVKIDAELAGARAGICGAATKTARERSESVVAKLEKQCEKMAARLAERDEKIAEARRRTADDRRDVDVVGAKLIALYSNSDELLKHARVVGIDEIAENEFNLNIPRYVDTFEPEPRIEVKDALKNLGDAENQIRDAETELMKLLKNVGYAS